MTDTARSVQIPERLRDQPIAALVPFFADSPTSDVAAARVAAACILDGYSPATPKELQLSTQVIAFGWAAMACLRTAMAAKNLSIDEVLRLQDHAIALDRSAQKSTKALDTRRKERAKHPKSMAAADVQWDEGTFQLSVNQAMDKLNNANAKLAAYMATLPPAEPKTKLEILSAEPMTRSVLSRRARD